MSKKSYKKLQNRLYREIKRRIQAEQRPMSFGNYTVMHQKIETIKAKQIFPRLEMETDGAEEFVKFCLLKSIAKKLFDEGYVQCYSEMDHDRDAITVECQLKVCRPDEYGSEHA